MEYRNLKIEIIDNIAVVKNHKPETLNALDFRFFEEMNHFLDNISEDIKLLIITGEKRTFVAGADISEMNNLSFTEAEKLSKIGQSTFNKIENLEIPVIAAVNGFALGGGCELALACDIRIASKNAKFGQPEVNLGIIPGFSGTQRLPRLIGMGNAMYMILTAEIISASEAKEFGLVQKIVEHDDLMNETLEIAKNILSKGPHAIRAAKYTIKKGLKMSFDEGNKLEAREFGLLFESDAKIGMPAFLQKRKPNWNL